MKKEQLPEWLRLNKNCQVIKTILEDLGAMAYYRQIEPLPGKVVFLGKPSFLVRCVILIYLHLKKEEFPVVLEDMVKYCGVKKIPLLSIINRNKAVLPYLEEETLGYVLNVHNRVYAILKHLEIRAQDRTEIVKLLYGKKYFYNKSPLLTCICVCLGRYQEETVLKISQTISQHLNVSLQSIKKEKAKIVQTLKDAGAQKPGESAPLSDTMAESIAQSITSLASDAPNRSVTASQRMTKEEKIAKAVEMYLTPIKEITEYSTDYESIMIEGLIKNGLLPSTIHHLTIKGMEYFFEGV